MTLTVPTRHLQNIRDDYLMDSVGLFSMQKNYPAKATLKQYVDEALPAERSSNDGREKSHDIP